MATGRVKWFNATRGYGFIAVDGFGDVFVAAAALKDAGIAVLETGMPVEFLIERDRSGRSRAVDLRVTVAA